ncbi:MAG TPA: thioredoxin domain-containing protein [Chthonomonadaceae bacterium]|nr:thioredoxin domain-containing protein [Chthonomonadaceae bacterium]
MSLTPPVTERDHTQGPPNAPVTLVEYGDYECPHCGHAYPIVKAIQEQIGDNLRFVYRNFPLSQAHPHAEHAAEAAEAAGAQGRFWDMHDILFERQEALDDPDLVDYAGAIGLDTGRFIKDMEEGVFADRVQEDFLSGVRSGVNGTPSFFINGARHDGSYDYETLLAAIEKAGAGG